MGPNSISAENRQGQESRDTPPIRSPRGKEMICKGWQQEACLRQMMNSLDDEVRGGGRVIGAGEGIAPPDSEIFHSAVAALSGLENDETLLLQSGRPAGVSRTSATAPRVLMMNARPDDASARKEKPNNSILAEVPAPAALTRGGWLEIGFQSILQNTFETLAAAARTHFGGDLAGRFVVSGGLGRQGSAISFAAALHGAAFLGIEVDGQQIKERVRSGTCDICVNDLDEALRILKIAVRQKQPMSVGLIGNCAEVMPELACRGVVPDLLTDSTSAYDLLGGYAPRGMGTEDAARLRQRDPQDYGRRSGESLAAHVSAMLELRKLGATTFEFGNEIRRAAFEHGVKDAFSFPDFNSAYLRPLLAEGRAPLRWLALSGEAADIHRLDDWALKLFPNNRVLCHWIHQARRHLKFQGLPARAGWLDQGEPAIFGELVNDGVAKGELRAPIVIGRVFGGDRNMPGRLAESGPLKNGDDARREWGEPGKLLEQFPGAAWVSLEHGGGSQGGPYRICALAVVADGSPEMGKRVERVLTFHDPLFSDCP